MPENNWEEKVICPPHYINETDGVECIDAIQSMLGPEGFAHYCKGQILKYIWRAGKKDRLVTDLQKAKFYLLLALGEDPRADRDDVC